MPNVLKCMFAQGASVPSSLVNPLLGVRCENGAFNHVELSAAAGLYVVIGCGPVVNSHSS